MDKIMEDMEKCKTQEELYDLLKGYPEGILLAMRTRVLIKFAELNQKEAKKENDNNNN